MAYPGALVPSLLPTGAPLFSHLSEPERDPQRRAVDLRCTLTGVGTDSRSCEFDTSRSTAPENVSLENPFLYTQSCQCPRPVSFQKLEVARISYTETMISS
jgi:hypothetical protein